jgi:hypothetical protein
MTNQELFKQAIADAKSVRDAAVANAKAALEETFTPKIMSMLSAKLNEMEEDEDEKEEKKVTKEAKGGPQIIVPANDANDLNEEAEYFQEMLQNAGIMARVEAGIGELEIYLTNPMDKRKAEKTISDAGYTTGYNEGMEEWAKTGLETSDGNLEEDSDMEEGFEDEIGYEAGQQKPRVDVDNANDSVDHPNLEEMDLDEILAELEKETGKVEEGKKEKVEEAKDDEAEEDEKSEEAEEASDEDEITELTVDELKDIIRDVLQDVLGSSEESSEEAPEEGGDDEESISLDELLAELDMEESSYTDKLPHDDIAGTEKGYVGGKKDVKGTEKGWVAEKKEEDDEKKVEEAKKEADKAKKDLEEAIKVIKFLKKELNEVNLLNAKNTYVNKIFKAKSLSESQKVNVLKNMDKATNVKEAKVIYESLISNLSASKKNPIRESIGFASKAAGVAPKQPIVEGDAAIRRMQQLAGIIK